MNVQNAVVKYLDEANLMQIVTVLGDHAWCATVFFAADNRHYLYWLSLPSTRHSHEIERNNRVCGAITLPHRYGDSPQGIQFEGIAREVPHAEIEAAFQSYAERFNAHARLQGLLSGEDDNRLYQITPTTFVLYDEEHFPAQPRQEWRVDAETFAQPLAPDFVDAAVEDSQTPPPYNPMNG